MNLKYLLTLLFLMLVPGYFAPAYAVYAAYAARVVSCADSISYSCDVAYADNDAITADIMSAGGDEEIDTMPYDRSQDANFWINRIKSNTFNIADTTIIYPRFAAFCVKVYNWADRTFNSYDHDYVMPSGKKWKVMWKNSNWSDSYSLDLPDNFHMRMLSDLYMSTGPYISFMAVTVGYAANLNRLISHVPARQKRYDFSFSTSLFEVDLYYTRNRGGTRIRRFEPYDQGKLIDVEFPSLQLENYGIVAFYFLNHRRYYQGAAYNYSKIQRRSQGSFMFGLAVDYQYIDFDLATLPDDMIRYLPKDEATRYRFVYNDYCLVAGYGFNWVFNPHWVFNITGMPSIGLKHCLADNIDGQKNLLAVNLAARGGIAYNLGNFFVGATASINANWYNNKRYSFINAIASMGLAVGLRF